MGSFRAHLTLDRYLDTQAMRSCVSTVIISSFVVILRNREYVGLSLRAIPTVLGLLTDTVQRVRGRRVSVGSDLKD